MSKIKNTENVWYTDLVQIDKEWLKGRLQEAVLCGDKVICVCSDSHETAKEIANLKNANQTLTARVAELEEALSEIMRFVEPKGEPFLARRDAINAALEALKKGGSGGC